MKLLNKAFEQYKYDLLMKDNVIGVGIGYKYQKGKKTNSLGIVTMVTKKVPLAYLGSTAVIPSKLKGVSTDVWETGHISSFQSNRRKIMRPAQPGSSLSHFMSEGAGTFGAVVRNVSNKPLILSNNHILANLTNGRDNRCQIGDTILQPGVLDGGTRDDVIGFLKSYIPLNYGNSEKNPALVDAALAEPVSPQAINSRILNIGIVTKDEEPILGQSVFKSGRGSGLTVGEIVAMKVMLKINYGSQLDVDVVFDDQILATTSANPGDSGSLLVTTSDRRAVGLLLGGGGGVDVYNKISNVFRQLFVNL